MSTVSQVLQTALGCCVPLFILWNIIVLAMILAEKRIIKRMKKFCESAVQTIGTVNYLIKKNDMSDSPDYYSSYFFYTANGEPFTGKYNLRNPAEYKEGLSVTVYYDKNNPSENVSANQLSYEEKRIYMFLKLILFGTLFWFGIMFFVFISQLIS